MKKITLLLSVAMFAFACGDKKTNDKGNEGEQNADPTVIENPATADEPEAAINPDSAPNIAFEQDQVTVPAITEGESVEVVFTYTNTGKSNLVLSAVEPTCGCTVADDKGWSKEPLAPGESEKIRVVYNSEGRAPGAITKSVVVRSNALAPNDVKELTFSLQVNPKK
jgi:hypothetical protein